MNKPFHAIQFDKIDFVTFASSEFTEHKAYTFYL